MDIEKEFKGIYIKGGKGILRTSKRKYLIKTGALIFLTITTTLPNLRLLHYYATLPDLYDYYHPN